MLEKDFWAKWEEADCLGKQKLVETLPMYADGKICCPLFSPTLINSYFEDLYLHLKGVEKNG